MACAECQGGELVERVTRLESESERRALARAFLMLFVVVAIYAWQSGWIKLDLSARA